METKIFNKEIQEEISKLETKIEKLKSWNKTAEISQKIVDSLPKELNPTLSVGIEVGQLHGVLIHVNLKNVSQVTDILKQFNLAGYHLKDKPEDYEEIQRRSWYLKNENEIPIVISGFFREGEGQQCKFVKTGEEMKPVYKLVCDDSV